LKVGETATFTASYAIPDADIGSGQLNNRAEGTGITPNKPNGDPSTPVTDESDSSNPNDPNETGVPGVPNENDPTGTLLNPPVAVDDTRSYIPGQPKDVSVIDNDGSGNPLVGSSIRLTLTGTPNGTLSPDGLTLNVPNEGEWRVNSSTGVVTFTPESGYLGNPTPPTYFGLNVAGLQSNEARIILQASAPPSINEPIPTLSEWSLMLLMMLLGFVGYRQSLTRRKRF
jgi:hypothetical protein